MYFPLRKHVTIGIVDINKQNEVEQSRPSYYHSSYTLPHSIKCFTLFQLSPSCCYYIL